jgi:hypothetical protein
MPSQQRDAHVIGSYPSTRRLARQRPPRLTDTDGNRQSVTQGQLQENLQVLLVRLGIEMAGARAKLARVDNAELFLFWRLRAAHVVGQMRLDHLQADRRLLLLGLPDECFERGAWATHQQRLDRGHRGRGSGSARL